MKHFLAFILFGCFALPAFSQYFDRRCDSALWNSPVSAEKAVQLNIRKVIVKEKRYRRQCRECVENEPRTVYGTLTTVFEYDRQGYPVSITMSGVKGSENTYVCRNDYKDGQLLRSFIARAGHEREPDTTVYTRHYTTMNLRDTNTWFIGHTKECQLVYTYDPASRVVRSEVYNGVGHYYPPASRKLLQYDDKNRPVSVTTISKPRNEDKNDIAWTIETVYAEASGNSTSYLFNHKKDTFSIYTDIRRGNNKRRVTCRSPRSARPASIEKISKKGNKEHRYYYRHVHGVKRSKIRLEHHHVSDAGSGLILKKVRLNRRELQFDHGIRWRRLLTKKTRITRYIYETYDGKKIG